MEVASTRRMRNTGSGSVESSGEESSGGGSENQGTEDGGEMGE